jgi:hypothetical protein
MLEELSPETRDLLNEARGAEPGAPLGAKARVWRGLEPQLALTAAGGLLAPSAFAKAALAATTAVAVGVIGAQLVTREPAKPTPIVVMKPSVVATERAPEPAAEPVPAVSSVRAIPRAVRSVVPSRLSEETALLAQVNAALRGGQPSRALLLLGDYDRRFSGGELRVERSAARVFALCALGQTVQARAEAARFLRAWPRSPLSARVSGSCGGPLKASP